MSLVKTSLVVEGGGLRGAFAVGVLRVLLERLGSRAFDGIFAVSSGVFAATYYAADQGQEMEDTWRDRVCGNQLVDHRNWLNGKPVLQLDYLIELFKGPVRLDVERVFANPSHIEYVLTDFATGAPRYLNAKQSHIFDFMRASSALPRVYPLPVTVAGHDYYDGGQSDPIPVGRALAFGATHIVVVRTRPAGFLKEPTWPWLSRLMFAGVPSGTPEGSASLRKRYNESVKLSIEPPAGHTVVSFNPNTTHVGRLTRSQERICAAIDHGKDVAHAVIAANQHFFVEAFHSRKD